MLTNLKYWAGLIDADGSFDIVPFKSDAGYTLSAKVHLYQKDLRPLELLSDYYGVPVRDSKGCSRFTLVGYKAVQFINEIKNHLVIKRNVAEYVSSIQGVKVSEDELKVIRSTLKLKRKEESPAKPFPSRKWMAGYIDGDGCLLSSYRKSDGVLEFKLSVVSHYSQSAGLELMHRYFGGTIVSQQDVRRWNVSLSVSQGKRVLEYFTQHLLMKQDQANLILECLRSKRHIRRYGATAEANLYIHRQLQSMKTPATTKSQGS